MKRKLKPQLEMSVSAEPWEASGNVIPRVLLVDEKERALGTWLVSMLDDCL